MADHSGFSPLGNHVGDVLSAAAVLLALLSKFFGFLGEELPSVSALAAIIWFCLQIWASPLVQGLRHRRRTRKIAKLRASIKLLETEEERDASKV